MNYFQTHLPFTRFQPGNKRPVTCLLPSGQQINKNLIVPAAKVGAFNANLGIYKIQ
jgi:hypothetical protein